MNGPSVCDRREAVPSRTNRPETFQKFLFLPINIINIQYAATACFYATCMSIIMPILDASFDNLFKIGD
jgi:hypothetical protein